MFEVTPSRGPTLRDLRIEPNSYGLRLKAPEGAAARLGYASTKSRRRHQAASRPRISRCARRLRCHPSREEPCRSPADRACERAGAREKHRVYGRSGAERGAAAGSFQALRARRILFWRILPAYSPEAVESDMARVVSLYLSKGYFDAGVRVEDTAIHGEHADCEFRWRRGPDIKRLRSIARIC